MAAGETRTIVCGVDFGEESSRALTVAAGLAARLGARLVLAHVARPTTLPGVSAAPGAGERLEEAERQEGEELLESMAASEAQGVEVERVLRFGDPAGELAEIVRDVNADLLVVGSHGRGAAKRAVLGSVSSTLARDAAVPVVVVPPHAEWHFAKPS